MPVGERYIGISAAEAVYGNAASMAERYQVTSESLTDSHEYIDVETTYTRELRRRLPGPWKIGGSFDSMIMPDMARLFCSVCGKTSHTQSLLKTGAYKHVFVPKTWFEGRTLYVCSGVETSDFPGVARVRRYTGAIVQELALSAPAREAVTGTFNILGKRTTLMDEPGSPPAFSTLRPYLFFEGGVEFPIGSAYANIEAFNVTHNNDLPDDLFVLGDRYWKGDSATGPLNISGSMDVSFTNWDMWEMFLGGAGYTEPSSDPGTTSIKLLFTGALIVTGYSYTLEIRIPKIVIDTSEAYFNARDRIVSSCNFTGLYDSSSQYVIQYMLYDATDRTTI